MRAEHKILENCEAMYKQRVQEHGVTAKGLDWKDENSQAVRFSQLSKLFPPESGFFSVNDLGCGFGDLHPFLQRLGFNCAYHGYDILPFIIDNARLKYPKTTFSHIKKSSDMEVSDYVVASGIFSKTFGYIGEEEWWEYIINTLRTMFDKCTKGIAFNALTSYSEEEFKRPDLYYTDPCRVFDFCKRNLSPNVALLHDYGLYDFTILVRK